LDKFVVAKNSEQNKKPRDARVETHQLASSSLGVRDTPTGFVSSENVVFLAVSPEFDHFAAFPPLILSCVQFFNMCLRVEFFIEN